jgi:Flp pilus assembly CpaF family ATPase
MDLDLASSIAGKDAERRYGGAPDPLELILVLKTGHDGRKSTGHDTTITSTSFAANSN